MKKEVVYLSDDKVANLTAYLFEGIPQENGWAPKQRPAILIVPGGGYAYCSEREGNPVALTFNNAGYQAFVLRYHCGEASAYPTPLIEIAKACLHIRNHRDVYGVEENEIAVIGFSGGGHLAALLGSNWHRKSLRDLTGLMPEEIKPNALLLVYPVANLKAFVERLDKYDGDISEVGAMKCHL